MNVLPKSIIAKYHELVKIKLSRSPNILVGIVISLINHNKFCIQGYRKSNKMQLFWNICFTHTSKIAFLKSKNKKPTFMKAPFHSSNYLYTISNIIILTSKVWKLQENRFFVNLQNRLLKLLEVLFLIQF